MYVRILTLRYNDNLQGFPEGPIREAAAGREILDIRDHFFVHGNVPHLLLMLLLGDGEGFAKKRRSTEDPGKDLPVHLQKLYRDIRQWRNERAKRDGIPSYVIMRNTLVAEICQRLPRTLSELKEIEGIGEAKCAKYGNEILEIIPHDLPCREAVDSETDQREKKSSEESGKTEHS